MRVATVARAPARAGGDRRDRAAIPTRGMRAAAVLCRVAPRRGASVARTTAVSSVRTSIDRDRDRARGSDTAVVTTMSAVAPATIMIPTASDSMVAVRSGVAVNTVRTGGLARAWAPTSAATGEEKGRATAPTKALTAAPMVAIGTRIAAGGIALGMRCARGWETMMPSAVVGWTRCGSEVTTDAAQKGFHARTRGFVRMSASV